MANEENPKNIKVNDKTGLYTSKLMNDSNKIQMEITVEETQQWLDKNKNRKCNVRHDTWGKNYKIKQE